MTSQFIFGLLAAACLSGCPSSHPSVLSKPKPNAEAGLYEYGWRDAGFRTLPGDPDSSTMVGGPKVRNIYRFGADLILQTSVENDSTGYQSCNFSVYHSLTKTYTSLRIPNGHIAWAGLPFESNLFVGTKDGTIFRYSPRGGSWDSIANFGNYWVSVDSVGMDSLAVVLDKFSGAIDRKAYNLKTKVISSFLSKDTTQLYFYPRWSALGRIFAITSDGNYGWNLFQWNPSLFIWEIVPGTENIFKIGSPYNPVAVSGYRGDLYIASQYGDIFRMKNGQPPCVRMDTKIHLWNGDTLHNLVSLTNLKVLDGRLYSTGSTVAVLDTVSDQWMEIAPSWLSGPLPSGSPYSTYDRGCFSNGGGWDLAKVGDTLYFASNRGLWYVDLKTTLTCKLDYTKNDSCGKVARIQSCIPPEQYCCDYQHGTVDWCKYASCPNAAARRVGNPVSP